MRRERVPEMMDDPAASRPELERSLEFIRGVNRRLGGTAALLDELSRWKDRLSRSELVRIVDVGTGSADIPVAAVRWGEQHGVPVRVTAVDNHPTTLALAREHVEREGVRVLDSEEDGPGVELVDADAAALVDRLGVRSFDVAHAGMFVHHLDEVRALTVLRVMDRLATRGLVFNDLWRSRLAQLGVWVMTLRSNEMVKHDARWSVRAGFTPREGLDLAKRAGWESPVVRRSFVHQRFSVVSTKMGMQA